MKTFPNRTLSQFNKSHSLLSLENGVLLWYHQTIQTDAIIFKGFPTTALYAIVKNCILLSLLKSRKCCKSIIFLKSQQTFGKYTSLRSYRHCVPRSLMCALLIPKSKVWREESGLHTLAVRFSSRLAFFFPFSREKMIK